MPTDDPYAGYTTEAQALEAATKEFFEALGRRLPSGTLQAAIKSGQIGALAASQGWRLAVKQFAERLAEAQISLMEVGLQSGVQEIPRRAPRLSPRIGELARREGGKRAVALAEGIDKKTAAGLRRMIGRAANDWVSSQELKTLRLLEKEIRSVVGVTVKQAARIERWRLAAVKAGMPADAISSGVASRAAAAKAVRAQAIADRGVVEAISYARHRSWVEAVNAGDLPPDVKKVWITQSDKKVRPTHRAQARAGPIPLNKVYPIMGVMHPPSKDRGCRCWQTLLIP